MLNKLDAKLQGKLIGIERFRHCSDIESVSQSEKNQERDRKSHLEERKLQE
jgi:hypothetical protein